MTDRSRTPDSEFDERWLSSNGIVPVDIPTTGALIREIQRLRMLLSEIGKQNAAPQAQDIVPVSGAGCEPAVAAPSQFDKPHETPRTDELERFHAVTVESDWDALQKAWALARQLERELAHARQEWKRYMDLSCQQEGELERSVTRPHVAQGEPVAYIEHHKGGDNLVWEQTGLRCTPLYALRSARGTLRKTDEHGYVTCDCPEQESRCKLGRQRTLLTAGFARCAVPESK